MNELTIYAKIDDIKERIKNKEDKGDVLGDINEVLIEIKKTPLFQEYINLLVLYEKEYDVCIFGEALKGE